MGFGKNCGYLLSNRSAATPEQGDHKNVPISLDIKKSATRNPELLEEVT
jgi:hypothetical protein